MKSSLKLVRRLKKLTMTLAGQPRINEPPPEMRATVLAMQHLYPDEAAEYLDMFRLRGYTAKAALCLSFLMLYHYTIEPSILFTQVDFIKPENNCLLTNCSHLSGEPRELAENLLELNFFSGCYRHRLNTGLFTPIDNLSRGKFNHMVLLIFTTCAAILYPVCMNIKPLWSQTLMMMVAPHITRQLIGARLRAIHEEISHSFVLFKAALMSAQEERVQLKATGNGQQDHASLFGFIRSHNGEHFKKELRLTSSKPRMVHSLGNSLMLNGDETTETSAIDDYYSVVQTLWWSRKHTDLVAIQYTFVTSTVSILGTGTGFAPHLILVYLHNKRLAFFKANTEAAHCAFWYNNSTDAYTGGRNVTLFDLTEDCLEYTFFNFMVLGNYFLFIVLVHAFSLALLSTLLGELHTWLNELNFLIVMSNELARVSRLVHGGDEQSRWRLLEGVYATDDHCSTREQVSPASPTQDKKTLTAILQEIIIDKISFNIIGLPSVSIESILGTNNEVDTRLALQRLAYDLLKEYGRDCYVPLMRDTYINLRQFVETVKSYDATVGPLIIMFTLGNYAYAGFSVFLGKKLKNFTIEAIALAFCVLLVVSALTTFGARFNAASKRLFPSMRALLATTSDTQDITLRHLRSLWFKMVEILDEEDGIHLRGFGIKVKQSGIIPLSLGTLTIVVLSFK